MDNKTYLLAILDDLKGVMDIAEGLYEYIKVSYVDEEMINALIEILSEKIKSVKTQLEINILNTSINKLNDIKQREIAEMNEGLGSLDNMLSDI